MAGIYHAVLPSRVPSLGGPVTVEVRLLRRGAPLAVLRRCISEDILTGDWRVLDLQQGPFHLPAPMRILNEGCTEGDGMFADWSLGLWRSGDLRELPSLESDTTSWEGE